MSKFETRKIMELLEMRIAMSGKPSPVARKVVLSLQASL